MKIAIVGAGPVGLLLALQLCRAGGAGHEIHVFEKRRKLDAFDKKRTYVISVSDRGLAVFKEVLGDQYEQLISQGSSITGYTFNVGKRKVHADFRDTKAYTFSRTFLVQFLLKLCTELPNFSLNFSEITSVDCVALDPDSGKFDIIVGADGAFSTVRKTSGISFRNNASSINYRTFQCDVDHEFVSNLPRDKLIYFVGAGYSTTLAYNSEIEAWIGTFNYDRSMEEKMNKQEFMVAQLDKYLHTLSMNGKKSLASQMHTKQGCSKAGSFYCDSFHKGKVVLVGDAAHGMVPNLGQGLNCGLQSARILAKCILSEDKPLEKFTSLRLQEAHMGVWLSELNAVPKQIIPKCFHFYHLIMTSLIQRVIGDQLYPNWNVNAQRDISYYSAYWWDRFQRAVTLSTMVAPLAWLYYRS